jgi:hypothetical protein
MRLSGWSARLAKEVERHRLLPFAWGQSDCVLFAADCAVAVTGVDPIPVGSRGAYDDEASASRILTMHGYADIEAAASVVFEESPRGSRGDWAVVDVAGRPTLGIVLGPVIAMKLLGGREHLTFVNRLHARRMWAVG